MSNIFAGFFATIVTIPIISMFLIYVFARFITKNNKRSFHVAIDTSTFFFIIGVHYLIIIIWDQSYLWVILMVLVSIGMLMVIAQYKVKQEIHFKRVIKGFWRFNFLLFFLAYFCLALFGVMKRIYESFV
jgi:multisubunit Na+/H+ antiporter MnhF subunit